MDYLEEYREKLASVEESAYGEERKELIKKTIYTAIKAGRFIYVCSNCNKWVLFGKHTSEQGCLERMSKQPMKYQISVFA